MCPNRIYEQYHAAANERDDAILSIFVIDENFVILFYSISWIQI